MWLVRCAVSEVFNEVILCVVSNLRPLRLNEIQGGSKRKGDTTKANDTGSHGKSRAAPEKAPFLGLPQ